MTIRHYAYAFSADAFVAAVNGDYGASGSLSLSEMEADCAARLGHLTAEQRGFLQALRYDDEWFGSTEGGPECWVLVRLAECVRALPSLSHRHVAGFDALRRIGQRLDDSGPAVDDLVSGHALGPVFARLLPAGNSAAPLSPPFMAGWLPRARVTELSDDWPRITDQIEVRRLEMLNLIGPVATHSGVEAERLFRDVLEDADALVAAARDAGSDVLLILD